MRKWISSFTLIEMLVVIAIIAILSGLLLPALARAREESRRKSCDSNLSQIVKACTTYQEPNGDFFPAFTQAAFTDAPYNAPPFSNTAANQNGGVPNAIAPSPKGPGALPAQGCDGTFQPMPSLAVLYPAYVDNVKVFACPSTADKPQIAFRYYNGARHTCFGFQPDPLETGTISTTNLIPGAYPIAFPLSTDPAIFTGNEVSGPVKSSYFYDELTNFRDVGPGQAIACDADGQTWLTTNGKHPPYYYPGATPSNGGFWGWARSTISNHDNGQNVMYFDGHVKWSDTVYASRDPNDNIFNPEIGWGADTDAYLWDGTLADSRALGQ